MSYAVNVFVRGLPRGALLALLEAPLLTNTTVSGSPDDNAWVADVFGVAVTVVEGHDMNDDQGIAFSAYPLMVVFTLYGNRIPSPEGQRLCVSMAQALAAVARSRGAECLVVEEMQRVIGWSRAIGQQP